MPILLPGFACLLAASHLHFSLPETLGGFLTLALLLPFASAVLGLLIQALRFVIFDRIVTLVRGRQVNLDSPDAYPYALYANLSIFWGVFSLASISVHCFRSWDNVGRDIGYVVVLLAIWYALSKAAMLAYHRSHMFGKPATRKRKTTRKTQD